MKFSSERSERNTFGAIALDRAGEQRYDVDWIARQHDTPDSVEFFINREGLLGVQAGGATHALQFLPCLSSPEFREQRLFLGSEGARAIFLRELNPADALTASESQIVRWADLRAAATRLSAFEAGVAAYGRGLHHWHQRHGYCGVCGTRTVSEHAGHRRKCLNPDCKTDHFPRTDPAIIVAVQHEGRLLLGRQAVWPEGRYSTLAGFVEPGETLEHAVRREVYEEAGVRVGAADYHSSQPWPFPASLMLGFTAHALSEHIQLGPELQDARWFSVQAFVAALQQGTLKPSLPISVAYRLIEHWLRNESGLELAEVLASLPSHRP